jgi:hypothetical protein
LITSVLSRSGGLVVNWSAPSLGGGDPLTGYTLSALAGTTTQKTPAGPSATTLTLSGLTNGTTYLLSLVATSAAGTSAHATSSGTPEADSAPEAPESLQVIPDGKGNLVVTWSAPADPGSSAVSGYTVSAQAETQAAGVWSPSGTPSTLTLGSTATTTTLSTLSASGFYTVSVVATSAAGSGPAATTANPVTPTVALKSSTVTLSAATMNALGSDRPPPPHPTACWQRSAR